MADITISTNGFVADGTTLGAYPRSAWGVESVTGAPSGSAVSTGVAANGRVSFGGLADKTTYFAYDSVSGLKHAFSTPASSLTVGGAQPVMLTVEDALAGGTAHMAHRGNGHTHLDNSLEGFEAAFQSGHNLFDGGDLWLGSDGQLINFHNGTATGELLTGNGNQFSGSVPALGVSGFKSMTQRTASDNAVYANLPNEHNTTFDDVCVLVRRFGNVVITPELKSTGTAAMTKLISTVQKHHIEKSVIVQAFTIADLKLAHDAGLKTCWLASTFSDATTVSAALANGIDFYGYDFTIPATFTPTRLQAMYDAGVRLAPWTLTRKSDLVTEAARVGRPISWCASNYGTFTGGRLTPGTTDPFGSMVPFHGQMPSGNNRGVFTRQGKLSIINGAAVHQGWASQDTPNQTSIQVVITYETIGASGTLGAYVIFGATDDRSATFSSLPQGGYILKPQPNGTVTWQKWNGASFSTIGSFTLAAGAYSAGGFNTFKMEMLASSTKVTCVETGQSSTSASDTTWRGGHLIFGNSASDNEVSFSAVTIT